MMGARAELISGLVVAVAGPLDQAWRVGFADGSGHHNDGSGILLVAQWISDEWCKL
jgi:hypothetical protein